MRCKLVVLSGPEQVGAAFPLSEGDNFVGRVDPPSKIRLNGTKVSKRHCNFHIKGNELVLKDLKSSNGLYVNGKKIESQKLVNKDRIVIGEFLIEVKVES